MQFIFLAKFKFEINTCIFVLFCFKMRKKKCIVLFSDKLTCVIQLIYVIYQEIVNFDYKLRVLSMIMMSL